MELYVILARVVILCKTLKLRLPEFLIISSTRSILSKLYLIICKQWDAFKVPLYQIGVIDMRVYVLPW